MVARHVALVTVAALLAARAPAQSILATVDGAAADDHFGRSVAAAGDVNGDGYTDFIVGEPFGTGVVANSGLATIYSGKDHSVLRVLKGTHATERFGWAVAGTGDLTGDGVPDVVVGEPFHGSPFVGAELGAAHAFNGATGVEFLAFGGAQPGELLGYSIDGAGDWNGDGVPDIVAGAPYYDVPGPSLLVDAGAAEVVSGVGPGAIVLHIFNGISAGDNFGWSVAGAGDVSGGGRADIVVGAPFASTSVSGGGKALVYSGEFQSLQFAAQGSLTGGALGFAVDGGGDINADGLQDIIAGAYGESGAAGAVRTFLGPAGAAGQFHTGLANDRLGGAVANVGDADKDGFADLAGGAYQPFGNGYFRVWSGKTGQLLYASIPGQGFDDEFGGALGGVGDFNFDGWPDLLVGGDLHDGPGGTDAGRAYVYDLVTHQTDLGFQGPGTAKADAYGQPIATGNQYDIWLTGAKPFANAWLVASAAQHPLPFKGGTLVPDLGLGVVQPMLTDGAGRTALQGLPGGGGSFDIFIQFVVKDAAQLHGYELSNAVKVHYLP